MNDVAELELGRAHFEPGVVSDMPAEIYHAVPALGSGGARVLFEQTQAHFKTNLDNPKPPTANMELGTVVHAGVLQPELLVDCYAVAPDVDKRGSAGKAVWAEFLAAIGNRIVLTAEQEVHALGAIAAVRAHPGARRLLDDAITELSLFWEDGQYKVPCKARIDACNRGLAIDLKTTQDASEDAFIRTIASYRYNLQAAHYVSGAEHALNESPRGFVFIAVETSPPYAVACYHLGRASFQAGQYMANVAYARYAESLKTGKWPAYPDTIKTIELPRWALRFDT